MVDLDDANGFVIADIPGLIEGASEGIGLGHEFLKHIERTKVIIHMVDAASVEGRNPVEDIHTINNELASYNKDLLNKPWVIAANKIDAIYDESESYLDAIKKEFEPEGIKVFPISAVSGKGLKELLYYVQGLLDNMDNSPVIFEAEYDPNEFYDNPEDPYTVFKNDDGVYCIEGPRIEKCLDIQILNQKRALYSSKTL